MLLYSVRMKSFPLSSFRCRPDPDAAAAPVGRHYPRICVLLLDIHGVVWLLSIKLIGSSGLWIVQW